ncbi:sigma-70 family RNA polymerase sigma factor [Amycolatopsis acidicola]|uniref:Sigma-70 family RNA polymerase sigma factor n=1 Tax=Amycolatopsis acidicola TaxID=2596893 RepID=A0A5N0URP1_9PSEU|nr:sigma-70 family RNA polymerase sigma factor [Amycolatopsis acidicola]KAA9153973.1 sigma-70 family RNA polymerase sigma factor [Amycolatopsis acidicola]
MSVCDDSWELVHAVQGGDLPMFGEIYRRYHSSLIGFFVSRQFDRATAEDLTSETFVRALQAIRTVRYQGRDLGAWLVTIARNLTLDYRKSGRARRETSVPEVFDLDGTAAGPEVRVLAAMELDLVCDRLGELTGEQRNCLLLRRIHGYSVAETAALLGRSEGATRALQHRAERALASLMADAGKVPAENR